MLDRDECINGAGFEAGPDGAAHGEVEAAAAGYGHLGHDGGEAEDV